MCVCSLLYRVVQKMETHIQIVVYSNHCSMAGGYPGICQGVGALLKFFSKVAKKSIFISLTYSRGHVYVCKLLNCFFL